MRKKNSNKWLFYIIGGIIAIIIVGLGIKFLVREKTKKTSGQQKSLVPLHELSDEELEKCLLEDFSRRLELKKYFVFSLKELKKGKVYDQQIGWMSDNARMFSTAEVSRHLTTLATAYESKTGKKIIGNRRKKEVIIFKNQETPREWTSNDLDQKIEGGGYVFFEKENNIETTYFSQEASNSQLERTFTVCIDVNSPTFQFVKTKSEALELLTTDPALSGKV